MSRTSEQIDILIKVLGAQGIADLKSKYQDLNKAQGDLTAAFGQGTITQKEFDAETKQNSKASAELSKTLGQIDAALDRQAKAAERAAAAKMKAFDQAIKGLQREQAAEDRATAQAEARAAKAAAAAAKQAKALEVQSTFAGKYRQNLIGLGYATNDFFSVQGSLSQRLNAIANNMPMLLSGFGGLGLALSGLLPIVGMVIQNWDNLKKVFGVTVDEGVTQLGRLEKRIKELSKEHVTLVVDRRELERSEQQLERLKKALSEFQALQAKQTPAEHAAGQQIDTALTEAGTPQITEELRQKYIREKTAESQQAGPLAEAQKAQADAERRLAEFTAPVNRPLERGEAAARAQEAEKAKKAIADAQEQARKARDAIEVSARAHVSETIGGATGGHGAGQARDRGQLAKELDAIGRHDLAQQVRGATPQAVKATEDFAEKQKAAIESVSKSGAADELSQRLAGEAQGRGLDPEAALKYVQDGVAAAFDEAFKGRGIIAPAGAAGSKEGQRAAKELESAITQIADRALAKAEAAGKHEMDEQRRAVLATIKQDDLAGIADKLAAAAHQQRLGAGAAFSQIRDALAKQILGRLEAEGLGGDKGREAAMGAAGPATGAALDRQARAAEDAEKKNQGVAARGQRRDRVADDKAAAATFEQSVGGSGIAEQAAVKLATMQGAGGAQDRFGRFVPMNRAQIAQEVQRQVAQWLHRQIGVDQRGRALFANAGLAGEETGLTATKITGMGQAQVDARMAGMAGQPGTNAQRLGVIGAAPGRPRGKARPRGIPPQAGFQSVAPSAAPAPAGPSPAAPAPQANLAPALERTQNGVLATQTVAARGLDAVNARCARIEQGLAILAQAARGNRGLTAQMQTRLDPDYPGNLPPGFA